MTAWLTAGLTEAPALREKTDILAKKRFLKTVGPVTHEADRDSGEVGKGRPAGALEGTGARVLPMLVPGFCRIQLFGELLKCPLMATPPRVS